MFKKIGVAVAGAGTLVVSELASATSAYDISGIQTSLTDVTGQVLLVGIAVVTVFVGIKAYKWIRRAL